MQLLVQPDDGIEPILRGDPERARERSTSTSSAWTARRIEKALARRDRPRRGRAHADRPHRPRRRKGPAQAGAAAAGDRRHRVAQRRRPGALPRQDHDRRPREAVRARLQPDAHRHRQAAAASASRPGSRDLVLEAPQAVRGRLRPEALRRERARLPGEPAQLARAPERASSRRARRQLLIYGAGDGQRDHPLLEERVAQGRRRSDHRQGRERPRRSPPRSTPGRGCTCAPSCATGGGPSWAARACAGWSSTRAARSA